MKVNSVFFNLWAVFLSILAFSSQVSAGSRSSVAFYGLSAVDAAAPYVSGRVVSFQAKWVRGRGNLSKMPLGIRRARWFSKKYEIYDVNYSDPSDEGWFDVTLKLPTVLKKGKYYLFWDNFLGHIRVKTPGFYVTTMKDIMMAEERRRLETAASNGTTSTAPNSTESSNVSIDNIKEGEIMYGVIESIPQN